MCIVDTNQSRLLRKFSPSRNLNNNNNKIQQNISNTTRRTAVFKSSIRDKKITKGSILRLLVTKVDAYGNEKDLTPSLYSIERVITNNK